MEGNDILEPTQVSRRLFLRSAGLVAVGALVVPSQLLLSAEGPESIVLLTVSGMQLEQVSPIDYKDDHVEMLHAHYREMFKGNYRFNVRYLPIDRGAANYRLEMILKDRDNKIVYVEKRPIYGPISDQPALTSQNLRPYISRVIKAKFRLPEQYDLSGLTTILKLLK